MFVDGRPIHWNWSIDELEKSIERRIGRKAREYTLGQFTVVEATIHDPSGNFRATFEGAGLTRFAAHANFLTALDKYGIK